MESLLNYREKPNFFKKFDNTDDDDDWDLEDLFSEFHGNSFNFSGFPPGIMRQFQEILEAMQDVEDDPDSTQRRKSFENKYNEFREKKDRDLDSQQYADQLDSLLKRISPNIAPKGTIPAVTQRKVKLSDEDKIMDVIHGTFREEVVPVKPRKQQQKTQKMPPASPHHFGGLPPFDLPTTSGTTWGRTVISIRKHDGSYETRKTERSSDGQTKTTITKTGADGTSSTQVLNNDGQAAIAVAPAPSGVHEERNLVVCDGYKIPCLW